MGIGGIIICIVVFVPLFIITFLIMRIDLVFHHLRKDDETDDVESAKEAEPPDPPTT